MGKRQTTVVFYGPNRLSGSPPGVRSGKRPARICNPPTLVQNTDFDSAGVLTPRHMAA
jgi:hypothetical protein